MHEGFDAAILGLKQHIFSRGTDGGLTMILVVGWDHEWAQQFAGLLAEAYPRYAGKIVTIHHRTVRRGKRGTSLTRILKRRLEKRHFRFFFVSTDYGYEACTEAIDVIRACRLCRNAPIVLISASSRQELRRARGKRVSGVIKDHKIEGRGLALELAAFPQFGRRRG